MRARAVLTLENQGHLLSLPPPLLRLLHVGLKSRPETPGSLSEEHAHHASNERVNRGKQSAVMQQREETFIVTYSLMAANHFAKNNPLL